MQQALTMTDAERLSFMEALNATAWAVAWTQDIGDDWRRLLHFLGDLLSVDQRYYSQFRAHPSVIADKVNQCTNVRVRFYFLRLTRDAFRAEMRRCGNQWSTGFSTTACRKAFIPIYNRLAVSIRLDGNGV